MGGTPISESPQTHTDRWRPELLGLLQPTGGALTTQLPMPPVTQESRGGTLLPGVAEFIAVKARDSSLLG